MQSARPTPRESAASGARVAAGPRTLRSAFMSPMRKSARIAVVAGLLAGLAAPVAAQYQPYPGQPYPPQPGPRGRFAHACFPAEQGGYLRIEWPQSGRWAVYNWPPGSNLRIYIGDEQTQ